MMADKLEEFWKSCVEPDPCTKDPFVADAIIANPPSFAHVHYQHGSLRTSAGQPEAVKNGQNYGELPPIQHRGVHGMARRASSTNGGSKPTLPRTGPMTEGACLFETLNISFTFCWSPALVCTPPDCNSKINIGGFFIRGSPAYTSPADLEAFLHAGSPPSTRGFGSIVVDAAERIVAMVRKAVQTLGVRAIISRGWSKLGGPCDTDVFYKGDCPHEQLCQHVTAAVHHGGAGITACDPRHGKPMNPAAAISFSLTFTILRRCHQNLRENRNRNGTEESVEYFHANLPLHYLRCDLLPDQPATRVYEGDHKKLLLSKKAASSVLSSHGKIAPNRLELRWDPITAILSGSVSTITQMGRTTADIFSRPYELLRHTNNNNARASCLMRAVSHTVSSPSLPPPSSSTAAVISPPHPPAITDGALVDISLAAAEILRAVPRPDREKVTPRQNVMDLKSGTTVADTIFGHVIYEALADIVVYTYESKRRVPRKWQMG
ncbi:uncharacterized protein Z518_09553 [Rhinocladiella mackenziei CBS 650.93]|uniref:Uncharacterized protein n=1 Tax=Rhinocladiella mackenziei CBS 650.93 TaxID=1442369 RepID=A0A0D2IEY8_9EURO|nr:uncharacterized protein Z518_09553 [Rhinocladiella mackenziei CBS 650.93]KIX01826.1 hypothetical protein Z518_09553 [Rhinocladiella mackenziei CBS 650.93]